MRKNLLSLLAATLLAAPAGAQTARPMLDYASAAKVRDGCIAWASERKLQVAVAVFNEEGRLLAYGHMDGAASMVGEIAQWKGRSSATIHAASAETAKWGNGPPMLATWQGGTPIFSTAGVALGGVGVSGASGAEDAACGEAGIAAAGLRTSGQ